LKGLAQADEPSRAKIQQNFMGAFQKTYASGFYWQASHWANSAGSTGHTKAAFSFEKSFSEETDDVSFSSFI
jgi:hypothetical protein